MRNTLRRFGYTIAAVAGMAAVVSLASVAADAASQGEAKLPKEKTLPVAKVSDKVITVKEVEDKLNSQNPFLRKRYTDPKEMEKFVQGMVDFEVLALEAKAKGYEKNERVQEAMRRAMVQRQMEVVLEQRASKDSITKKEIEEYYNKHILEFKRPERRRVAVIVVDTKEKADKVLKEAEKFKNNLRKFQELVRKYSIDDKLKRRGGLLPYFAKDAKNVQKSIVDAAFTIKNTGDLVGPVKVKVDDNNRLAFPGKGTKEAWAIIRLSGISPRVDQSLEQAEPRIRQRLWQRKRSEVARAYIKELREKYKDKIKIYEDKLDLVRIDTSYSRNPFGPRFHTPAKKGGAIRVAPMGANKPAMAPKTQPKAPAMAPKGAGAAKGQAPMK